MYKYRVESNILITQNICSLAIRANSLKDVFSFKPGQYVAMSFLSGGRQSPMRCFSIASAPSQKGLLEFGIRVGGAFTGELAKLRPGADITIAGPYGNLCLDPQRVNQAVLIAVGIGVTPFMSMARVAAAQKWPTKLTLLYGSKTGRDTAYAQELINLNKQNPNFKPYFFLSDEPKISQDKTIINGPINVMALEKVVNESFGYPTFYLCGPSGFVAAMKKILLSKNVLPEKIIYEEFGLAGHDSKLSPLQKTINSYTMAALLTCFIAVGAKDAVKTDKKIAEASRVADIQSVATNDVQSVPDAMPNPTPTLEITPRPQPRKTIPANVSTLVPAPKPTLAPTPKPQPSPIQTPVKVVKPPVTSVS